MIVKTTKAAILAATNMPLIVDLIDLPFELTFGQVLVEIEYSGICGAQLNEISAAKGEDKFLPHLLGHEGCGRVLEIGPCVTTVSVGQKVCLHWRQSGGYQSPTPVYHWKGSRLNAGWITTFNNHAVISENRLTPVPEDLDSRLVPLFGCAVTTAMGVVNNDAQVSLGQSVVVFGSGGVGLNIIQFAKMVGAEPVVAIDILQNKLEMAMKFGATHVVISGPEAKSEIKKIVGNQGADIVIDTTGNARVIEMAYELTHPDGRTILVGVPAKDDKISIYTLPLHFKKILTGSHGGSIDPSLAIPRLIKLIRSGRIELDDLITHEFPLDKINDALELFRSGHCGRILLSM
jgi:S-(hydroxymethyl)glutathione dehydrogenase/alcohol dehydrogenase